mmetsp:Transcript_27725/g.48274  ORF Transcript_27725/g.48274 Transcript_27725/m.48274 type:complete len:256 (+) Transcript_27725:292-1059(+)
MGSPTHMAPNSVSRCELRTAVAGSAHPDGARQSKPPTGRGQRDARRGTLPYRASVVSSSSSSSSSSFQSGRSPSAVSPAEEQTTRRRQDPVETREARRRLSARSIPSSSRCEGQPPIVRSLRAGGTRRTAFIRLEVKGTAVQSRGPTHLPHLPADAGGGADRGRPARPSRTLAQPPRVAGGTTHMRTRRPAACGVGGVMCVSGAMATAGSRARRSGCESAPRRPERVRNVPRSQLRARSVSRQSQHSIHLRRSTR